MNGRMRALKRLQHARERLRDAAAARVNVAGVTLGRAVAAERAAQNEVEARLDTPPVNAHRVGVLMTYDDERLLAAARVVEQHDQRISDENVVNQLRAELNDRERALRSTERQILLLRQERLARRHHAEQVLADDLSGRRKS